MKRRDFIILAAAAGIAGCDSAPDRTGRTTGRATDGTPDGTTDRTTDTLAFANRLRIPPLLEPAADASGVKAFTLTMQRGHTEFLAGKPAPTWGFNGSYLGPTLRAARGDKVRLEVLNQLGEETTVHWHGMRVPAVMDGGPQRIIEPGSTWTPYWTVDQPAATTWYHPHPHGFTAQHVYRGLAGMFLLDDPQSRALGLPDTYGVDDFPLVVQDKVINSDGTLSEDKLDESVFFLGDRILVNGTYDPYLEVGSERVRLRILNASNARLLHIGFADGRGFQVIGTDAGLLPAPEAVDRVSLSPAERVEVVVAFTPGENVVLRSFGGRDDIDRGDFDLLKIVAAERLRPSPAVPGRLAQTPPIEVPAGARVRRFELDGTDEINGRDFDMSRIDEIVPAGAREIWEVKASHYAHNFHIHEVALRVLDIDGKPPPAWYQSQKDTVYLPAKSTARLAVEFGRYVDPRAPYMYHCHMLRHEDKGMMGQFVLVEPGTEAQTSRTIPAGTGTGTGTADGHGHG
ncbi:multicopper oxidase family protein [Streptomyces sp. AP-93]|uniref:multicopper oxidase family protein n=1 Tax=Streptomyces sp. AP-93 TaxID=2929048 RepID=UPI001FAFD85D|nr:multicopper oxidase domain-containing protein [Streptomyces sp. AP-93]MCJ0869257.1 multicopper oxidase domain-containing protein [Streptomyces sp. AP-93]